MPMRRYLLREFFIGLRLIRTRPRRAIAVSTSPDIPSSRDILEFSRQITVDWRECVTNDLLTSFFLIFFLLLSVVTITVTGLNNSISLCMYVCLSSQQDDNYPHASNDWMKAYNLVDPVFTSIIFLFLFDRLAAIYYSRNSDRYRC